jgi:amino acid permease
MPEQNILMYYIITGFSAAFIGFTTSYIVIHFYDYNRQSEKDVNTDKIAAKKVSIGVAVAFALIWIFLKRVSLDGP